MADSIDISGDHWAMPRDLLFTMDESGTERRWFVARREGGKGFALRSQQLALLRAIDTGEALDSTTMPLATRAAAVAAFAQVGLLHARPIRETAASLAKRMSAVELALWAVLVAVQHERWPWAPPDVDEELVPPRGCYVCLKRDGLLRGCFGSITPRLTRLADDIAQNTMAAAFWDYRFHPLAAEEVPLLDVTVDIIGTLETINYPGNWSAREFGLQLTDGPRVLATLLPGLKGVETAHEQYALALRKAALPPGATPTLARFTTSRYPHSALLPLEPFTPQLSSRPWALAL